MIHKRTLDIGIVFQKRKGAPTVMKFSVAAEGEVVSENDFNNKDGKRNGQRTAEMKSTARAMIPFPGVKEIKQVEPYKKWRPYVPKEFKDEACPNPAEDLIERQREERNKKRKAKDAIAKERKENANKSKQSDVAC